MPRKPQFSKEEIAQHGLKIVEERGIESTSLATAIAIRIFDLEVNE